MIVKHRFAHRRAASVLLAALALGISAPIAGARPVDSGRVHAVASASATQPSVPSMPAALSTSLPPILPRVTASQLATIEQADRQAAVYTPPKRAPYSDAETNAYADTATGHITSAVLRATTPHDAFDWGDAGIGAAGGLVLSLLGLGCALVVSRRRARRSRGPAALAG